MAKENKEKKAGNGEGKDAIADAIALLKSAQEADLGTGDGKEKKEGQEGKEGEHTDTGTPGEEGKEDLEHGEKSRIGRRQKRLEKEFSSFRSEVSGKLDQIIDGRTAAQQGEDDPEPPLSEIPTAAEVKAHGEWVMRQATRSIRSETKTQAEGRQKYSREYTRLVNDYVDEEEDPELFALLTDKKDLTYNSKLSDDPKEDFLANYRNAVAHLKGKTKTNVRGTETGVPRGTNTGASNVQTGQGKEVDTSKWTDMEKGLLNLFSKEEIAKMHADGKI